MIEVVLIIYDNGLNGFINTNTKWVDIQSQKFEKCFKKSFETTLINIRKMPESLVVICFSRKEEVRKSKHQIMS